MLFRNRSSSGFFEAKYRKQADPWNFAESSYEQARYDAILKAISDRRYCRAFEPGCSVGVLTERLGAICDHVEASDFSPTAAARATARCAALPHVNISCKALTADTSLAGYDLILFSEIGYYFQPHVWRAMVASFAASMDANAILLASHWLGHSKDHCSTGKAVHEVLRAHPLLQLEHEQNYEQFLLARFVRL